MAESASGPETVIEALKASHFKDVLTQYGEALRARRKGIDKMNVYPVPDGDTGTNMSLTVASVVSEMKNAAADDMRSVATAVSKGAILGARGNSGAILAQILRGISETAKEKTSLNPHDVADALERAKTGAYESVLKPVEGTMLTVVSAAAVAARKSADEGHKLKEQLEHIRTASAEALARTPELLPVLKQAGVVDAGGSGFLLFVDALRYVATGEPIPGLTDEESGDEGPDLSAAAHTDLSDLRYEIMFLLEGEDAGIRSFREKWSEIGDSIVVVGGDGTWNCHIHSDDIGKSIEMALDFGRPREIRITDLMEQVGAEHGGDWFGDEPAAEEQVETAVVAVVAGSGLEKLYRSAGAQRIVTGGQSMNPSVADLLAAVEAAPAQNVVLLPNNKNVHAAAKQVNELTEKEVTFLPTTSVVQGLCSLVGYNAGAGLNANTSAMDDACNSVITGEVTQAVRATNSPAGKIKKGDWLGISADGIGVIAPSMSDALVQLVGSLTTEDHELLTLVEGDGADDEATAAVKEWASANSPELEVEIHEGGQPLYPYLLGLE